MNTDDGVPESIITYLLSPNAVWIKAGKTFVKVITI